MNLTTLTRFKSYAGITVATHDTILAALITAVSNSVAKYLGRDLVQTTYREWINGNGSPELFLPQYPITRIYNVGFCSSSCARVKASASLASVASVTSDGTSIFFDHYNISTGAAVNETLVLATYPTLGQLESAINALASGVWTCEVDSSTQRALPSILLRPFNAQNAIDNIGSGAVLEIADRPEAVHVLDAEAGLVRSVSGYGIPMRSWPAETLEPSRNVGFPEGERNIFIHYTAGYVLPTDTIGVTATLPEALELLVQQMVKDVFMSRSLNRNLTSETLPGYSYTVRSGGGGGKTGTDPVASIIANYRYELSMFKRKSP